MHTTKAARRPPRPTPNISRVARATGPIPSSCPAIIPRNARASCAPRSRCCTASRSARRRIATCGASSPSSAQGRRTPGLALAIAPVPGVWAFYRKLWLLGIVFALLPVAGALAFSAFEPLFEQADLVWIAVRDRRGVDPAGHLPRPARRLAAVRARAATWWRRPSAARAARPTPCSALPRRSPTSARGGAVLRRRRHPRA